MKKTLIYSFLALGFLTFAACDREVVPADETGEETGELIRIKASGSDVNTRGLLNKADLPVVGTTVKVYDYLTGFTGKIDGQTYDDGDVMYIDDAVQCVTAGGENSTGDWDFVSYPWRWTRSGVHNFFGWLTNDAKGGTGIPEAWNTVFTQSTNTLAVGPITFDKNSPQFDFSYSDIVTVAEVPDDGVVTLPLSHLFSALAVTIENSGEDDLTIKSVTVSGINNTKKAALSYASSPVEPTFSGASSTNFFADFSAGIDLSYGTVRDLYTGEVAGTDPNFILMWPQTATEMASASVTVVYNIAGVMQEDGVTPAVFTLEVPLNKNNDFSEGMKAGHKYALNLKFAGKTIDLRLIVMPWDYNEYSLDYSDSAIDSGPDGVGEMDFDQHYAGYNRPNRTVTLQNQNDVINGQFAIYGPHTGNWALSVWGDGADYFTVSPTEGEINFDLSVGRQVVNFTVTPSTTVPASTVTLHFKVSIMLNGEWVDADSEFNRKDWKIVWER